MAAQPQGYEPPSGPDRGPGSEPDPLDYRFTLANERTVLAWLRTCLALMAGSVAVSQLLPTLGRNGWARGLGGLLAVAAIVVAVLSYRRWLRVEAAMVAGGRLPGNRLPVVLTALLVVVGVAVAVVAVLP